MDLKAALFNKFGGQIAIHEESCALDANVVYQDATECEITARCVDGKQRVFKVVVLGQETVFTSREDLNLF